jgi:hypothetical protein
MDYMYIIEKERERERERYRVDAWHKSHLVGVGVVCHLAHHPVDLITKRAVEP